MFTYIYKWNFYRFIKSGMLIDFFFKKLIFYKLLVLFIVSNIYFSEKFFIEYNFLIFNKYFYFFKNFLYFFNTQFAIRFLAIANLFICMFLFIYLFI